MINGIKSLNSIDNYTERKFMFFNIIYTLASGFLIMCLLITLEAAFDLNSVYLLYFAVGVTFSFCIKLLDCKQNKD